MVTHAPTHCVVWEQAWDNAGGFDAVIQSLLVVGSGKVMTLSKKKPVSALLWLPVVSFPHVTLCWYMTCTRSNAQKSPEELDNMVDELTAGAEADTELVTS